MTSVLKPFTLTPEFVQGKIAEYFQDHQPRVEPANKPAAVLIPIIQTQAGLSLLYTRRSELVKSHKGQVSFPGGAAETFDRNPVETALREANEEIALPRQNVRILGQLDGFTSTSRFNVTPVVGWIQKPFQIQPNPDEVARVFTVPLEYLSNPVNVEFRTLETPWGRHEGVVFYEDYDGETVWGFTGMLTLRFLQFIQQYPV